MKGHVNLVARSQLITLSGDRTSNETQIQNYTKPVTLQIICVLSEKSDSETMKHFFYDCSHSISLWKDLESTDNDESTYQSR